MCTNYPKHHVSNKTGFRNDDDRGFLVANLIDAKFFFSFFLFFCAWVYVMPTALGIFLTTKASG